MELDIIYNPYAGGEKKMTKNLALVEAKLKKLDVVYRLHKSEYPRHAIELTKKAIEDGAKTVVAMGGDGTLNEVVNGLCNFENITFGLLPCGTGNDFAGHLGIPEDVEAALDIVLQREAKYIDFIQIPNLRAINVVGMGIDVEVLKLYSKLEKKTKIGYTNCLLRTLFTYKCVRFTSETNGVKREHKAFLACVANASMIGGGMKISPASDVADGKLNFVFVDEIKGLKILPALIKFKKGKLLSLPQAHSELCDKITISSDKYSTLNVDGELYENQPFSAEVVHETLKMHR